MKWPYALLIALYCAGIFHVSGQPLEEAPELIDVPGMDKVLHAGVYGLLGVMVAEGLRRSRPDRNPAFLFWAGVLFASAYGLSDEVHQYFVPNRSFDPWDWVADTGGALAACMLLARLGWRRPLTALFPYPRR